MTGHIPERTCLVCRKKSGKDNLFRICQRDPKTYFFDETQKWQSRGWYICKDHECLKKLSRHKKFPLPPDDLLAMLKKLEQRKKEERNYLNLLKPMKNSGYLTFGVHMILEEIEHVHFIILATDISENPRDKILEKARRHQVKYIYYGTKAELGDIFGKDEVNAVGVKNKKIAGGLIDENR
ncbi:MAG: DUF448 domain-containing protein [Fusobacteriaceae bacterium]|jgi:predicted RNA-binding protein YlxR (DUF448 family)|nr:DUF448 domain-containing protein [Fusobacteriaceae bacterium]